RVHPLRPPAIAGAVDGDRPQPAAERPRPLRVAELREPPDHHREHVLNEVVGIRAAHAEPGRPPADERAVQVQHAGPGVRVLAVPQPLQQARRRRRHRQPPRFAAPPTVYPGAALDTRTKVGDNLLSAPRPGPRTMTIPGQPPASPALYQAIKLLDQGKFDE